MKKLHVFGLAVFAIFAFGSLLVTPALAASKILANGVEISGDLEVTVEGELVLHNLVNNAQILCSGIFDALINTGGITGAINAVLMLGGLLLEENFLNLSLVSTAGGEDLECVKHNTVCEENPETEPILVVAYGLPWATEVLLELGEYLLDFAETAGYSAACLVLNILFEISCDEAAVQAKLFNDATTGDLMAEFNETGPEGLCCDGSTAILLSDAPAPVVDGDGALLTVSE